MWRRNLSASICLLACIANASLLHAQSVQFSQPSGSTIAPPTFSAPPGQLGTPTFDPFAGTGSTGGATTLPRFGTPGFSTSVPANSTPWPGTTFNGAPPTTNASPWWGGTSVPATPAGPNTLYPTTPGYSTTPGASTPFTLPPANTYGGYGAGPAGSPSSPGVLFPNGMWGPGAAGTSSPWDNSLRLIQHPRLSETYLYGDDRSDDVSINDIETAVTMAMPNFLFSTQPLYLTPTFVLHLWDGPNSMAADLPPNAYSAFVDAFWASDPNRPVGAELGVAVGAFTDFETFTTNSIRVFGEGFGVVRLTPQLTFKLGVWYLNRNDLKLLPAGGLVWQPSPQMKLDLLFPNPKFTQYLTTVADAELWWYVSAEYGGGAWTIQRADGTGDRVDINDIRVKIGFDWINQRNWRGYFEIGYVFDRQVVYVVDPTDNFNARDTFLAGMGFSF